MVSRAELWEQYKEKFDAAKKLDRLEGTLVFLAQPVKVGRFYIAPVTLERLLYLEAIESPFVGGGGVPGRLDVLKALWILSPHFRPGKWRGRAFAALNIWLNWKWYAVTVAELFGEGMELMKSNWGSSSGSGPEEPDRLWAASMIDGFASQYGWPLKEILTMPLLQISKLSEALGARLGAAAGAKTGKVKGRHSDAITQEYLTRANKITEPLFGPDL